MVANVKSEGKESSALKELFKVFKDHKNSFMDDLVKSSFFFFFFFNFFFIYTQTITVDYIYNSLQVTVIVYKKRK